MYRGMLIATLLVGGSATVLNLWADDLLLTIIVGSATLGAFVQLLHLRRRRTESDRG